MCWGSMRIYCFSRGGGGYTLDGCIDLKFDRCCCTTSIEDIGVPLFHHNYELSMLRMGNGIPAPVTSAGPRSALRSLAPPACRVSLSLLMRLLIFWSAYETLEGVRPRINEAGSLQRVEERRVAP